MELDNATLQAYLDGELSPAAAQRVAAAIAESKAAQAKVARLTARHNWVHRHISSIAPATAPNARRAWQQWQNTVAQPSTSTIERIGQMKRASILKQYQSTVATLAVVIALAIAFSFAPVRALAGNFLQIFRVQQVKIVPVDMAKLETMQNNDNLNALLQQLDPQTAIVSGSAAEPRDVPSLDAAKNVVGFSPLSPSGMGRPDTIKVKSETVANISLDRDLLAAVFDAADISVDLPDSLDNTPLVITMPPTVIAEWTANGAPSLMLMQMPSPQIEYPEDLNLNALGVAGLQLTGMSKAEATALGATIDWANTLVLPIPTDAHVSYREVTINGGQGIVFTSDESPQTDSAVMWQVNGMSYFMTGNFSADDLLTLAASMQ